MSLLCRLACLTATHRAAEPSRPPFLIPPHFPLTPSLQAAAQGRVLLTRDTRLVERRDCALAYLLSSDSPEEQLREVARQWGISFDPERAMSR